MSELNQTQLNELQQQLIAEQLHLRQQLDSQETETQPVTLDQQAVGRVSRIDAIQQQQMAMANQQHNKQHLSAVNQALARMADDDYGFCQECDQLITFARLKIKPEALYCISCQGNHE